MLLLVNEVLVYVLVYIIYIIYEYYKIFGRDQHRSVYSIAAPTLNYYFPSQGQCKRLNCTLTGVLFFHAAHGMTLEISGTPNTMVIATLEVLTLDISVVAAVLIKYPHLHIPGVLKKTLVRII